MCTQQTISATNIGISARGKILDTENTQQIDTNDSSNSSDSSTNPSDSENDQDNNSGNNDNSGQWSIIPEIGDGACLLRCISRRVHNNPALHHIVRAHIIAHITTNLYTVIPGSGFNTFHDSILAGANQELVEVAGSQPTTYSSVEEYLHFMSQPYAYATNVELIAATQLYGVDFRITYHTEPQQYPNPPPPNVCDILYYPHSFHYASLRYTPSA